MTPAQNDVGSRVEALLAQLRRQGGEPAADTGDELVRILVNFYGEGLSRLTEILAKEAPDVLLALVEDPLVESQLILHDLHPVGADERIEKALDKVRPYLGSHAGGVAYLGIDDHGIAHLRLDGSCKGCPSSTITVKLTIEEAVLAAAPELAGIEVEGAAPNSTGTGPDKLMQIGLRPGLASSRPEPVWLHPSKADLPADGFAGLARLDGRPVLLARLGGTYFAYADHCPACSSSLLGGEDGLALDGDLLGCGTCQERYDVRLAGRNADRPRLHLEPLPLLDDTSGIRIALLAEAVA